VLCSCWGEYGGAPAPYRTGQADPQCLNCYGEGYVWETPQVMTGIVVQTMLPSFQFGMTGQIEEGDLVATVPFDAPAFHQAAFGDRFILLDVQYTQFEHVVRGNDMVREIPVSIDSIAYGVTTYRPGLDYQVKGQTIAWVGNAPPMNATYGVRFQAHPTYQLWLKLPQPRIIDNQLLPERWWLTYRQNFMRRVREGDLPS